ncbi:hypothetical protein JCGZ_26126 [Jatropha curcas]|uniref:Tetraspanin n=1 Tax=Jatropha curcas TaxID=180498 RepID=A0A067JQM6_JATCU|nr:tetraspanin-11-like [Jatropha curcas]KDP22295.1 hypothetical protein JCGZ_26126 [Jatropha curcas]
MARVSNIVIATLNIIFLVVGLSIIAGGLYVHVKAVSTANTTVATALSRQSLQNVLFILGSIVFIVSLLGLAGSCCRNNFLLVIYLIILILMIIGLLFFTIFVFVVTNERAGQIVSGKGFKEYRLGDYSHWLQNHFVKGKNWDVLRRSLIDAQVCRAFADDSNRKDFFHQKFSPIEVGCCRPPAECGFVQQNATTWMGVKAGREVKNSDCKTWSNEPKQLCYKCNSCKAGFLANIKKQWRNLAVFLICITVFIIVVLSTGCCVKRNNYLDKRCYTRFYYA